MNVECDGVVSKGDHLINAEAEHDEQNVDRPRARPLNDDIFEAAHPRRYDFWQYALKHTHDLKFGSFRYFCRVLIPSILKVHSSLEFSHVEWDDSRIASPCVRVYTKNPHCLIAAIPYPISNGLFKLNHTYKNMILEEMVARNIPLRTANGIRFYVKSPMNTTYDTWTLTLKRTNVISLKTYTERHIGTIDELMHFADRVIPYVPSSIREFTWRHILTSMQLTPTSSGLDEHNFDDLWNKRIAMPHDFISILFIRHVKQIQRYINKGKTVRIPRTFEYAFMTGNWDYGKTGIMQSSLGHNHLATISDSRKIVLNIKSRGGSYEMRRLLPSHFGFYCCVETTEGETCGLVRQLAITATVSNHVPFIKMFDTLRSGSCPTWLNGLYIGEYDTVKHEHTPIHTTVTLIDESQYIWCDGGRLIRPVTIDGAVTFIDSFKQRHTPYQEICDYAHLGVIPALLPYMQHNQSPRSMYVTQMIKQAIMWMPSTERGTSKRLWYPQRPLFNCPQKTIYGQNVVIAILCYGGYNQEDSLIFSRRAFDFGMFRHDQFTWHRAQTDEHPLLGETIPTKHTIMPRCINKTHTDVHVTRVLREKKNIYTQTRQTRTPQQGDKFCSMHGQKGICGIVMNPENMPFTRTGVIPDVIINTHAFPSRMTIGQIIEMLTGKQKLQPHASECEQLYDGYTGLPLQNKTFIGVATYLRLKHLVDDKIHVRGNCGPIDPMTKQPASGRARGGGLRVGEMEKDTILAHGCVALLENKFFYESDPSEILNCSTCGAFDGMCEHHSRLIPMASATKLLIRELRAMHVNLKLKLDTSASHTPLMATKVHLPEYTPPSSPTYTPLSPTYTPLSPTSSRA